QSYNARVSKHAIHRFLERHPGESVSEEQATISVLKLFSHARPILFKKPFMVERQLNNGQPADYFFHQGWIFVVTQEKPPTIMTVERQGRKKLGRDFWYTDSSMAEALT